MRARTRAELENAEATSARVQRVFEHGIAARQEVDDATARADSDRRRAERGRGGRPPRAQRQVERATVRSPLAGRGRPDLPARPASWSTARRRRPIVEVADPSRLELDADATASDLVRLQKGQARRGRPSRPCPGAAWTGTVSAVSPAVDRATGLGVVRVELNLGGPSSRPPIGVLGTARVERRPARARPWSCRKEAVRSGVGAEVEVVLCGADGLAHVRRLRARPRAGDKVEATGLPAGQAVVVEPVLGHRRR